MFGRLVKIFAGPSIEEREHAYLAESISRYDLEAREREIQKGKFRHKAHRFY